MIKPYINMANRNILLLTLTFLLLSYSLHAATLKGTIYNSQLNPETDVLLEITTQPLQKYLAKDGTYQFTLQPGNYTLTAQKNDIEITEHITITQDGTYVIDLFLLPSSEEDQDLWNDLEEPSVIEPLNDTTFFTSPLFRNIIIGILLLILLIRIIYYRRKYGPLNLFRKRLKQDQQKTQEQHLQDIAQNPTYLQKTIDIIKSHDGRINQKELRQEMLYLSEAKVSLIITELEHKNLVEKVKKGRGNVIILKNN